MRILLTAINYAPEKTSVGPFNTGLAEFLASLNHEVTVITAFPYYPQWRVWAEFRGSIFKREMRNDVRIFRVRHFVPWKPSSVIQRLLHDLTYAFGALVAGLFAGPFDIVYCSAPPVAGGFAAALLRKLKRARFVLKMTDLSSDAALATGILNGGTLFRAARRVEGLLYGQADAIVCLCHGFVEKLVAQGIDEKYLRVISDWVDVAKIRPLERDNGFRHKHKIRPDQFVVLHSGNMGKKQRLSNVVQAASLVPDKEQVRWFLVGDGEERKLLEQEASEKSLSNVQFLPLQPADEVAAMFSAADVLLLNQKTEVVDAVIPSKLLGYMAAGRPILAAVHEKSEAARYIRMAKCGLIVPPENPEALVSAVDQLRNDCALCSEFGRNARHFAEVVFARERVLRQYQAFFESFDSPKGKLGTAEMTQFAHEVSGTDQGQEADRVTT